MKRQIVFTTEYQGITHFIPNTTTTSKAQAKPHTIPKVWYGFSIEEPRRFPYPDGPLARLMTQQSLVPLLVLQLKSHRHPHSNRCRHLHNPSSADLVRTAKLGFLYIPPFDVEWFSKISRESQIYNFLVANCGI